MALPSAASRARVMATSAFGVALGPIGFVLTFSLLQYTYYLLPHLLGWRPLSSTASTPPPPAPGAAPTTVVFIDPDALNKGENVLQNPQAVLQYDETGKRVQSEWEKQQVEYAYPTPTLPLLHPNPP